ncbi:MAG: NAD(P)-dependent oxidoreductase [Burkholderiaceae bacterium]
MQKICFIGLGMMGSPMAARLAQAGYPLWVADADAGRARQFAAEHGASAVALAERALPAVDVVITMLPNSAIVESVLLGADGKGEADGLLPQLAAGTCVIDMSSSEPLRSRALAATLAARGVQFLDAPVSGGVKRAVDGSLAIIVGGDAVLFEAQKSLLACMGKSLFHVGPAGAGHAVKALNNYVSAAGLVAAVEALRVGERFGVDPAVITDVLNVSSGSNNTTLNKVKQFMLNGAFNSGFSLQLMAKDLGIAMQLGRDLEYPMALGEECLALWTNAAKSLDRTADHTEMYRLLGGDAQ